MQRLEDIKEALIQSQNALALLGFGSTGQEIERLDDYSDLDFIVIVKDGYKEKYIENLSWLNQTQRLAFVFMSTADGFKVMYEDGIYCEFAVVEAADMEKIPHAEGRLIWSGEGVAQSWLDINKHGVATVSPHSTEWLIGEIMTFIYIGLCRFYRGEKLSGYNYVQVQALNLLLELICLTKDRDRSVPEDIFAGERRFEQMYAGMEEKLKEFLQGYSGTAKSAEAIILYLDANYEISEYMRDLILDLCENGFYGNRWN